MQYEAEPDLRNANTDYPTLLQLVGSARRVLDVGCGSGRFGADLVRHGCRVAGVERDPEAAEAAENVLDEVLLGDVDDLDLVGHFGKETFDVVFFGGVLEQVADPVETLRKVRPLLAEDGSVVASIANVAHGAVRLALLKGRFEYGPGGLLDAGHVRFFTRGSVYETFREAGLVPVDVRRTTAGVFETEIGVRREDFDPGVVDAVEGDPESTTYRFVLRAVPDDSAEAIAGAPPAPAPVGSAARSVGLVADWSPGDGPTALAVRVLHAELTRRLPGATVRVLSSSPDAGAGPHDGGLPVEALGPWTDERAARLSAELDCLVVVGDVRHPAAAEGAEVPVVPCTVPSAEGEPPVPDPLVLVPRILPADGMARRLELVRAVGGFPASGSPVVVAADPSIAAVAAVVGSALDRAVANGSDVVLLPFGAGGAPAADAVALAMEQPVHRVAADAPVDDAVCAVANARAVVVASTASPVAVLARAYGVPVVTADAVAEALAGAPGPGVDNRRPSEAGGAPDAALDARLDRVATIVESAAGARAEGPRRPALPPAEHVAAVLRANGSMRERLLAERLAIADHVRRQDVELRDLRARAEGLERELRAATARLERASDEHQACGSEVRRLRAELEALRNIRVLRALRPARAVYARLRGGRL